jgi:hypothetical protein
MRGDLIWVPILAVITAMISSNGVEALVAVLYPTSQTGKKALLDLTVIDSHQISPLVTCYQESHHFLSPAQLITLHRCHTTQSLLSSFRLSLCMAQAPESLELLWYELLISFLAIYACVATILYNDTKKHILFDPQASIYYSS